MKALFQKAMNLAARAPGWTMFCAVSAVLLVFNLPPMLRESGLHNHLHLADAFLHGRLDITRAMDDTILFQGKHYVPFPPFPAIVLVPFVALFGLSFKTMALTPFLGGATAAVLLKVLRRAGASAPVAAWLTIGFVFGSVYWLVARYPLDSYFAHCVAVLCLLLALGEALGRKRGLLVGFLAGFACLSRQLSVFTLPFLWALMLWHAPGGRPARRRWGAVLLTGIGLAACLGAYAWYNWARFGAPGDDGYRYLEEETWYGYRMARWGNFHWIYLASNFLRMFLLGFTIDFQPPAYLIPQMSPWGTSLTFASPFVFYALFGRPTPDRRVNAIGGLSILACLAAVLLHKSANGGWQINGMRYALDFLPMALVFAATGMERWAATPWRRLWQGAVVYGIALNLIAQAIHYGVKLFAALGGPMEP